MNLTDFFNSKKTDFVQLSIPLRQQQGLGVTFINLCNPEKADVMYLPIAIVCTLLGFAGLLGIEMGLAYALGFI